MQSKNKTTLPLERVKRDLSALYENSEDENNKKLLNEKQMSEARDIVMKYNISCSQKNAIEICKDLVTKLKAIDNNNDAKDFDESKNNLKPKIIGIDANRDVEELTSAEKLKMHTRPLENIEMLRSLTNMPIHSKEINTYENHKPGSESSRHQYLLNSPTIDSCLLGRILKKKYPTGHSKYFLLSY